MLPEPGTMRRLLNRAIDGAFGAGISFSGGTDSLAILFCCLDHGWKPDLYTYYVEGQQTADWVRARWAATRYGLKLHSCVIPANPDAVLDDVQELIRRGHTVGKVVLQCLHGHLYIAQAMQKNGELMALNGSGVDGLYGSYREMAIASRRPGPEFDALRKKHVENPNDDAMLDQQILYRRHGVEPIYPYQTKSIMDILLQTTWDEMNRPKLKWITLRDFPEITAVKGLWRPRGSQQIVAGTRSLHDTLLDHPANRLHRKRVQELYKDLAAWA